MTILYLILSSSAAFFVFFILLFVSIFKENKKIGAFAALMFVLSMVLAGVSFFKIIYKTKEIVKNFGTKRTDIEVYSSFFGKPTSDCVTVNHFFDPVVPIMDNQLWLDFDTCPAEVAHIMELKRFEKMPLQSLPFDGTANNDSTKTDWATKKYMSDLTQFYTYKDERDHEGEDYKHQLWISKDSTHAFFMDTDF